MNSSGTTDITIRFFNESSGAEETHPLIPQIQEIARRTGVVSVIAAVTEETDLNEVKTAVMRTSRDNNLMGIAIDPKSNMIYIYNPYQRAMQRHKLSTDSSILETVEKEFLSFKRTHDEHKIQQATEHQRQIEEHERQIAEARRAAEFPIETKENYEHIFKGAVEIALRNLDSTTDPVERARIEGSRAYLNRVGERNVPPFNFNDIQATADALRKNLGFNHS